MATTRAIPRLFAVLIAIGYTVVSLVSWRLNPPQEFGDTYRYFGSTLFDIQNPGITPVFLYTALVDPWRVTLAQTALSVVVWLFFAWALSQRIAQPFLRWALPVVVLLVSLTPSLWSWNTFLSSESVSFSAMVLWLAVLVHVTRPAVTPWVTTLLIFVTGAFLIVTRPAVAVIVLPVTVLIAWWQWRTTQARVPALFTVLLTAGATTYGIIRLLLLSGDPTYRYRYAINNYVDKTSSFRAHADTNMPPCEPLVAAVNGPAPWDEVWVLKEQLMSVCTESYLWLQSGKTAATSWVLAVPFDAITNFIGSMSGVTLFGYGPGRALPDAVSSVLLPTGAWWLVMLGSVVLGFIVALIARVRPTSWAFLIICVAVVSASTAGYAFAIWAADGIELARHLLPVTALLPLAVAVLPTAFLSRPSGAQHS